MKGKMSSIVLSSILLLSLSGCSTESQSIQWLEPARSESFYLHFGKKGIAFCWQVTIPRIWKFSVTMSTRWMMECWGRCGEQKIQGLF